MTAVDDAKLSSTRHAPETAAATHPGTQAPAGAAGCSLLPAPRWPGR
jgi:hypothetical protein